MFVSVKSLTALIDQDIQFYIEGVASKEQHSPEEFEKWHKYIKSRFVAGGCFPIFRANKAERGRYYVAG